MRTTLQTDVVEQKGDIRLSEQHELFRFNKAPCFEAIEIDSAREIMGIPSGLVETHSKIL